MNRIGIEALTIYSQLNESVWMEPMVYGSFSRKKVNGRTYLYQEYSVEGRQLQVYLGEETEKLSAQLEAWKSRNKILQRLSAMAAKGGCVTVDRLTEAVLMRFAEAGWFRAEGVLVGSHAFALLGNVVGASWSGEVIKTRDVDIAAPRRITIAARPDIGTIIESIGFTSIPPLHHRHPPTSYMLRGKDTKIDFLTPETGRAAGAPVKFLGLGVAAHPLRFLDYLMEDSLQAAALSSTAVAVRVPSPARFALHKLILAGRRQASEHTKAIKDILQAESLLRVLLDDRPGDVDLAYKEIERRRWKKHLRQGIAKLSLDVRASLQRRMS